MEPDTHLGTPRRSFSPASDEDGSEAHATVRSDCLNVARICHVQTAENRVRLLKQKSHVFLGYRHGYQDFLQAFA